MSHWRSQVRVGLAAALLASILAASLVATTVAFTTANTNPSVTVPLATPTSVGINYTWSGTGPSDSIGPVGTTGFAVTLPAGYYWTSLPVFTPSPAGTITFSGPAVSNGGLTETWTLASFTPSTAWTLVLSGGTVVATGSAGTGSVTLAVGAGTPVQIASLTSSVTSGTVFPVTASPTAVPANGTSTVLFTFTAPVSTPTCTAGTSFTVHTTAGMFTTTTLPGVTSPVNGSSVTVPCASFGSVANTSLALQAPTTAGTGTVTVTLAGATSPDAVVIVTFTPVAPAPGSTPGTKSRGAHKVTFYATASATTCAPMAQTPPSGTKGYGFAVVDSTGNHKLNVEVSLKGAAANATYTVWVQQAPGTCSAPLMLRTNAHGNGNRHFHLTLVPGASRVWVTASNTSGAFVTSAAVVTPKGTGSADTGNKGNKENRGNGQGQNQND